MITGVLAAAHTGGSSGSTTALIFTIVIAYACGLIARRKGRSRLVWFILGALFSVITLVAVLVLPRRGTRPARDTLHPDWSLSRRGGKTSGVALRHARTVAFLPTSGIPPSDECQPESDDRPEPFR
jgi:hypothetical protein